MISVRTDGVSARLVIALPTVIDCRPSPVSMRLASILESEKSMRERDRTVEVDIVSATMISVATFDFRCHQDILELRTAYKTSESQPSNQSPMALA
jgi:hypothetical protein